MIYFVVGTIVGVMSAVLAPSIRACFQPLSLSSRPHRKFEALKREAEREALMKTKHDAFMEMTEPAGSFEEQCENIRRGYKAGGFVDDKTNP